MCGDQYCMGTEAAVSEWEELQARRGLVVGHSYQAILGRPAWPPITTTGLAIASRDQAERDEWREDDARQRYRDAGGRPC